MTLHTHDRSRRIRSTVDSLQTIEWHLRGCPGEFRCEDCLAEEIPELSETEVKAAFEKTFCIVHRKIHTLIWGDCGLCKASRPVVYVI